MQRNSNLVISLALAVLMAATVSELWGQTAYRLDRSASQIVTDQQRHWERWQFPMGALEIDAAGVQPRRWSMDTSAANGIVDFLRERPPDHLSRVEPEEITLLDAISAGSNREGVPAILDGDPATYWEPAPLPEGADMASRWWFTLDLGRLVVLNRIVLRFVDGEDVAGDPFLLFDVLTSDGQTPLSAIAGETLEFLPGLQQLTPNTNRRLFEIDFSQVPNDDRTLVARFVQVVVRGSRLDRAEEIDVDEYERLPEEDRGAVEYMKLRRDGQILAVPAENYLRLPEDRQGPIRHYRRERPRLAELEIWEEGEDLARGLLDRGGSITTEPQLPVDPESMLDGDIFTSFPITPFRADVPALSVDLGSFYWIESVRFVNNLRGAGHRMSLGNFQLEFSDGSRRVDGSPNWVTAKRIEQEPLAKLKGNSGGVKLHRTLVQAERHRFGEPIAARFFRILYDRHEDTVLNGNFPVSELQLFGEGFQPRVSLESPLIDPRGTRTLTTIEWDAVTPAGTSVFLETRTSSTKSEVTHYFNRLGEEVTAEKYDKLKEPDDRVKIPDVNLKGDIVTEEVMGSDASAWSQPYLVSGSRITSPSPRDFVQIRATLVSDRPEMAATLGSMRLNYVDPLADRFLGEVTPALIESLAVERSFSLYVRPDFGRSNPGFDGFLLTAPDGLSLDRFSRIFAGPEQELIAGGDEITEGDLSEYVIADAVQLDTAEDSLLVSFPLIEPEAEIEVLRLDFTGRLFSIGGQVHAFARFAGDGDGETVWQQVDGGDAADGVDSNGLLVIGVQKRRQLMTAFDIPAVFTPNGDGVNDELALRFAVVLVGASRAVEVSVFDLSGRLVRTLRHQEEVGAGEYEIEWNGEDEAGHRVPPGVYGLRFHVQADDDGADLDQRDIIRTVAVAY